MKETNLLSQGHPKNRIYTDQSRQVQRVSMKSYMTWVTQRKSRWEYGLNVTSFWSTLESSIRTQMVRNTPQKVELRWQSNSGRGSSRISRIWTSMSTSWLANNLPQTRIHPSSTKAGFNSSSLTVSIGWFLRIIPKRCLASPSPSRVAEVYSNREEVVAAAEVSSKTTIIISGQVIAITTEFVASVVLLILFL